MYMDDMHAVGPASRFSKLIEGKFEETAFNIPVILCEVAELKEYNKNPGINFTVTPAGRLKLIVEAPDRKIAPMSLFIYAEGDENLRRLEELRLALENGVAPRIYTIDNITKRVSKNPFYEWYLSTSIKNGEIPIKGMNLKTGIAHIGGMLRNNPHEQHVPPLETWYRT